MTPRRPAVDRFMEKVDKRPNGCWVWVAAIKSGGYGGFGVGSKVVRAHRFAYEHFKGPVPDGLEIDHLCRNRACVNPDHLEAVDRRVNVLRGVSPAAVNAVKTHCVHGHEFTPENTYIEGAGKRKCRTCIDARRPRSVRCPGHARHWFAPYRHPGVVLDRCIRCHAPNPRWSDEIAAEMESAGYGAEYRMALLGEEAADHFEGTE